MTSENVEDVGEAEHKPWKSRDAIPRSQYDSEGLVGLGITTYPWGRTVMYKVAKYGALEYLQVLDRAQDFNEPASQGPGPGPGHWALDRSKRKSESAPYAAPNEGRATWKVLI